MNPYSDLYLYAKDWYKKGNIIDDLKVIVANMTKSKPINVSTEIVIQKLICATSFELGISNHPDYKFLMFCSYFTTEELINACLWILRDAPTRDDDREPLRKPSENILPLTDGAKRILADINSKHIWMEG